MQEKTIQKINNNSIYKAEFVKRELRGENDTKFIVKMKKGNEEFDAMLTIYEPPDINPGGRTVDENIIGTKYGYHLWKKCNIEKILDLSGKKVGVIAPEPILFKDNNPYLVTNIDGVDKVIAINKIVLDKNNQLKNILDYDLSEFDSKLCYKVGSSLAGVQLAGRDFAYSPKNNFPIGRLDRMLTEIRHLLKKNKNHNKLDPIAKKPEEIINWIESEVNKITSKYINLKDKIEFGVCHLDCHPVNLIDSKEGICFLDWGTVGVDSYIYDMTMGLDTFCCIDNKPDKSLVESFLEGYKSVRKMDKIEKENLLFFIKAGLIKWAMYRVMKSFEETESKNQYIARDNFERYKYWQEFINDNYNTSPLYFQ